VTIPPRPIHPEGAPSDAPCNNIAPFVVGTRVLVTTQNWFLAPDGVEYKGIYGTVKAVLSDADTLGIRTNARSTNWYVEIGSMLVAGCQIFYAVRCDTCNFGDARTDVHHDGQVVVAMRPSRIYNADGEGA
jgi:hypothetical protein